MSVFSLPCLLASPQGKDLGGDQKHHENLLQPVYVLNVGLIPGIQSINSQHSWE